MTWVSSIPNVSQYDFGLSPIALFVGCQSIFVLLRYGFYTMGLFEFDLSKSDSNLAKHGIDFVDAQAL